MRKNELELCEAVIRLFEEELGTERALVTYPEKDGSGPPVEVRLCLAGHGYALEHTLIEPFEKAIQTGKEFTELTAEISAELYGKMPKPGTYKLLFPVHPTEGRHRQSHAKLREEIVTWVRAAALEMHAESPERLDRHNSPRGYDGIRSIEINGIPLTLRRQVHWSETGHHDGALFLARVVGDDIEDQRRARIKTALDRKLGKLGDCRDKGDSTVLILEYSDIALTNHVLIGQALESLLSERADCPDHIFIADTTGDEKWYLFQPVMERKFSIHMTYIDVEPPKLAA